MKRISSFICLAMVLCVYLVLNADKNAPPAVKTVPVELKADINLLQQQLNTEDYDAAMLLIEQLLAKTNPSQQQLKAWLYTQQGQIFQQRRHYHYAIRAFQHAMQYLPEKRQHARHIKQLQAAIDGMQSERLLYDRYLDARNIGMARQLSHQVTIAYFYLDDNKWSKWSTKSRQRNQANLEQVIHWYKSQAASYGIDNLDINVRYFFIKSPNGIAREWLRDAGFFLEAQSLISQQLGYRDLADFSQAMTSGSPRHQLALVFHANNQSRSFASVCHARCHAEYVMLTEKMNNNPFAWASPQVQSHEILHLFGAMDLYNIRQAKDYAVTDLMNYYSQSLKYATIDPITAWAIGWQQALPKTPFKVDIKKD